MLEALQFVVNGELFSKSSKIPYMNDFKNKKRATVSVPHFFHFFDNYQKKDWSRILIPLIIPERDKQ